MLDLINNSCKNVIDSMSAFDEDGSGRRDSGSGPMMETDLLELVVEKMSRLVDIMAPGMENIKNNTSMDSTTKDWLVHEYSGKAKCPIINQEKKDKLRRSSLIVKRPEGSSRSVQEMGQHNIIVSTVDTWKFKVLEESDEFMYRSVYHMLDMEGLCHEFDLDKQTIIFFFAALEDRYLPNQCVLVWRVWRSVWWRVCISITYCLVMLVCERVDGTRYHFLTLSHPCMQTRALPPNRYHNFFHACDVTHTVYRFMRLTGAQTFLAPLDRLGLLIAAVAHDVGHLGVNNQFLVKTTHDLALRHNDTSPLENMHAAVLYEVLKDDKTNIFAPIVGADWTALRKTIIAAILR